MRIPVYSAEKEIEGLADKIQANCSIAYNSAITSWSSPTEREISQKKKLLDGLKKSTASILDSDLYFTKSIFVSTNWNKNDDIFLPAPTWAARHTPSHKPTNLEHDETKLIGHITETWALDADNNIIPDNSAVDELPDLFHIANGAVIYRSYQDDDLAERTEELIEQIEAGTKYVSMECLFSNFHYGVITPENEQHVIARNKETSFLTKYLKIYGGEGEFDGCKIGRIIDPMTFSGKGYVDKPANPYSIIDSSNNSFNYSVASYKNPFKKNSGVFIFCSDNNLEKQENKMSDKNETVDVLQKHNDKLESTVASLQEKLDQASKASSEAGVKSLKAKVSELEEKLTATQKELVEVKESLSTANTEKDVVAKELEDIKEVNASLKKEAESAKAEKIKADRTSHLIDGGVDRDTAVAKVEAFESLSDDQFKTIAEDVISAAEYKKSKDKKEDDKGEAKDKDAKDDETKDKSEANADDEILESVEVSEELNLVTAAEKENEQECLRKDLVKSFGYELEDEDDEE